MLDLIDIITASFIGPVLGTVPASVGAMLGGASTPLAVAAIITNPVVIATSALACVIGVAIHRTFDRKPKCEVIRIDEFRARRVGK